MRVQEVDQLQVGETIWYTIKGNPFDTRLARIWGWSRSEQTIWLTNNLTDSLGGIDRWSTQMYTFDKITILRTSSLIEKAYKQINIDLV